MQDRNFSFGILGNRSLNSRIKAVEVFTSEADDLEMVYLKIQKVFYYLSFALSGILYKVF